jgi:hypothetical protein
VLGDWKRFRGALSLKTEIVCVFETSVLTWQPTLCHNPEDHSVNNEILYLDFSFCFHSYTSLTFANICWSWMDLKPDKVKYSRATAADCNVFILYRRRLFPLTYSEKMPSRNWLDYTYFLMRRWNLAHFPFEKYFMVAILMTRKEVAWVDPLDPSLALLIFLLQRTFLYITHPPSASLDFLFTRILVLYETLILRLARNVESPMRLKCSRQHDQIVLPVQNTFIR